MSGDEQPDIPRSVGLEEAGGSTVRPDDFNGNIEDASSNPEHQKGWFLRWTGNIGRTRKLGGKGGIESPNKSERQKRPILETIAIFAALLTVVLDLWLHIVANTIQTTTNKLVEFANTKFVAQFPRDIPQIRETITGTCATLDILTDTPGYGIYSSSDEFSRYKLAVENLLHNNLPAGVHDGNCDRNGKSRGSVPEVRLLVFNPDLRDQMNRTEQFIRRRFLDALKEESERRKFQLFCRANPKALAKFGFYADTFLSHVRNENGNGYEDFLKVLNEAEARAEDQLKDSAPTPDQIDVRWTKSNVRYDLYAWIQDDVRAVFSFQYRPDKFDPASGTKFAATEVAFKTEDQDLLRNLKNVFKQEWCRSQPRLGEQSMKAYEDYCKGYRDGS